MELDVRAAADGIPIVLHDATLARVQRDPRAARDLLSGDLADLAVPRLADALRALPVPAFLDIELKEDVGRAVIAVLEDVRGDPPDRSVISSFDPAVLQAVRAARPAWPTWLNATSLDAAVIAEARRIGCRGVGALWTALDQRAVRRAHDAGLVVIAWTVTEPSVLFDLVGLGVDGACVEGRALAAAEAWRSG